MLSSLLCMQALFAQEGPKPPTRKEAETQPSIVLLLQNPLELDVVAWRRSWSDIVPDVGDTKHDKNPWLRAEGDTLLGGWEGVQFVVRSIKEARTLADWQVRHMFEEERAELRAHRAAVEVVFVGTPPVGEPRHDAYRALASIAAALPKPATCIGVGFADHGTFDAVPKPLMLSQFKDPLNAMEPKSILRLFAAKSSTFDIPTLVAALSKEFGVEFSAGEYGKANTVRGSERYASAQVGDLDVSIDWSKKYQLSKQDISGYTDPAVQQLLRQHNAVLVIRATGPAGEVAEATRHRVLARIAAALWNDDLIGLNWRCSRTVVPATKETPDLLRKDDPIAATIGKPSSPTTGR